MKGIMFLAVLHQPCACTGCACVALVVYNCVVRVTVLHGCGEQSLNIWTASFNLTLSLVCFIILPVSLFA